MAVRDNLSSGINIDETKRITSWIASTDIKKNTLCEPMTNSVAFASSTTSTTLDGYLYTPVRNLNAYKPYLYKHSRDTDDTTKLKIEYGYLDGSGTFNATAVSYIDDVFTTSIACNEPKLYNLYSNYFIYAYVSASNFVMNLVMLQLNTSTHTFTAVSDVTQLSRVNLDTYGTGTLLSATYVSYSSNVLTFTLQTKGVDGIITKYYQYTFTFNTSTNVIAYSSITTGTSKSSRNEYITTYVDYDGTLFNVINNASNCSLHTMKGSTVTHYNSLISLSSSASSVPTLTVATKFINGFLYTYLKSTRSYFDMGAFSFYTGASNPVLYNYATEYATQQLSISGITNELVMNSSISQIHNMAFNKYSNVYPAYDYTSRTIATNLLSKNVVSILSSSSDYGKYRVIAFDNNSNTLVKSTSLSTGIYITPITNRTNGGSVGITKSATSSGAYAKIDFAI